MKRQMYNKTIIDFGSCNFQSYQVSGTEKICFLNKTENV